MKALLRLIIILAVVALVALSYVGFVPLFSSIFGATTPRDLGVTWTQADLDSARAKTGVTLERLAVGASPSLQYEGSKAINASFTSAELTALLNSAEWRDNPISDVQVKIGADGTIEASGLLHIEKLQAYAAATGIDEGEAKRVIDQIDWLRGSPAVYFKAEATVSNNRLSGSIIEVQVGKLTIPATFIDDYQDEAQRFMQNRFTRIPGLRADEVTFADGQMRLRGTIPAIERTAP